MSRKIEQNGKDMGRFNAPLSNKTTPPSCRLFFQLFKLSSQTHFIRAIDGPLPENIFQPFLYPPRRFSTERIESAYIIFMSRQNLLRYFAFSHLPVSWLPALLVPY